MKRLLLWLIGVALGVVVLLAAVLGVSYSFTSEGGRGRLYGRRRQRNRWQGCH